MRVGDVGRLTDCLRARLQKRLQTGKRSIVGPGTDAF